MNTAVNTRGIALPRAAACIMAAFFALPIQAESTRLDTVEVTADALPPEPSLTTPSKEKAKARLDAVPGGTTLVDAEQFRQGAVRDVADALRLTPGVFAQSRFGADETRLSIRGSGVSLVFNTRGIRLLRDGLPLNEADGNFRPQLLEPLVAQHIEVFRGANALEFGAATLGGAINIVSPNARTVDGYVQRFVGGSDAFRRFQVTNGKVFDEYWDAYFSLSGIAQDSFRDNGEQETIRFFGNVGYAWDSGAETRIHLNIQDNNLELPGSLTLDELEVNPEQANEDFLAVNSQRDFDLWRINGQHSIPLAGGGQADFGASFQHLDFFHPLPFALLLSDQNDWSLSARVQQPLGERHDLVYGGLLTWGETNDAQSLNLFLPPGVPPNTGPITSIGDTRSIGAEVFVQDTYALNDVLDVIAGTQVIFTHRDSSELSLGSGDFGEFDEDYFGVSPRLGLIWHTSDSTQLFTNFSRSFEAPTAAAFALDLSEDFQETLEAQEASTFEVGARGQVGPISYELALYYSLIDNEILTVESPIEEGDTITANADDTEHRGVELGINAAVTPWLDVASAYTFNDFNFDDDPLFGDNEIPSIPRHTLNAEFRFHHGRFSLTPTLQYADNFFVDFANTVSNDAYIIYGLKGDYTPSDALRIFVEVRNLGDEVFASNTATAADLGGDPNADNLFNPGITRSIFAGFELKL